MKKVMKREGEKMMVKVKVNIINNQKIVKLPAGLRLILRRSCSAVLSLEKFEAPSEVNITIVDNGEIHKMNTESMTPTPKQAT